jgi:hypothetical protein
MGQTVAAKLSAKTIAEILIGYVSREVRRVFVT